jgi:hypothetical protein
MVIEVDFSAWEKWQQGTHHEDEKVNEYTKKNLYQFAINGTNYRAKNASLVALIYYASNKTMTSTYDFVAEDEEAPIRKMLRTRWDDKGKVFIDASEIDAKTADTLHDLFRALPEPMYRSKEFREDADVHFAYHIHLPRYGDKFFNWGHDYYNFLQFRDADFLATVAKIMAICEAKF